MAGEIGHWCGIDLIGGGLGAVDKIDGAALLDKEGFLVVTPTQFAPFSLDADSGLGESSPQRIAPNTNPGDKRWILTGGVFAGLTLYGNVVLSAGVTRTIGHAAGPLITFDDTNNFLEITGCKVGIGGTPTQQLELFATISLLKMTSTTGTNRVGNWFLNTGGFCVFAREGSAGAQWFTGTEPYATLVGNTGNYPIQLVTNNAVRLTVSGGGDITYDKNGGKFIIEGDTDQIFQMTRGDVNLYSVRNNAASAVHINTQNSADLMLGVSAGAGGGSVESDITIKVSGKVGVNDTNPGSQFDVTGDINTTVNYKVDDTQVVSNQGAAVANATDAATTMARLNDLLARCRAHGLIAT